MTRSLVSSIVEPVVLTLTQGVGLPAGNSLFGTNISGAEFAPWNGQRFPTAAEMRALRLQGVRIVRFPMPWESLQPTLYGGLDATFGGNVDTFLNTCQSLGIKAILDVHNFGYLITQAKWLASDGVVSGYAGNNATLATGVNVLGDGTLTGAHLNDLLTKIATRWSFHPACAGIGIMNEPAPGIVGVNLASPPNNFTSGSWFATSGAVLTQLAAGTNPLGAAYGPAWSLTSGTGFGSMGLPITFAAVPYTLSWYAKVASGTDTIYGKIGGTSDAGHTVTTSWQRFSFTHTPSAGLDNFYIGPLGDPSGHTIQVANVQLEFGSSATTYAPNIWLPYAQGGINVIRAVNANVPIYVCGYNYGTASKWTADNFEMAALTGGNLVFEAHQYFDGPQGVGGGGKYSGSYTSYSITSSTGSQAFDVFKNWCTSQGVTGFIGEWGEPAGTDATSWLAVQAGLLADMRAAGIQGTEWFYGANGIQPSNILNIAGAGDKRLTDMLAA